MDFDGVASVVAVHGERRDQQRAVNTDGVHGGHHVVAGDLWRPVESCEPRAARVIAFVSVHLGVYRQHRSRPCSYDYRSKGMRGFASKRGRPKVLRSDRCGSLVKSRLAIEHNVPTFDRATPPKSM